MAKNQAAVPGGAAGNAAAEYADAGKAAEKRPAKGMAPGPDGVDKKRAGLPGEAGRERVFPLEVLRANCTRLFGCTSSTFDGAFFGADGKRAYTVEEAAGMIQIWVGRGING